MRQKEILTKRIRYEYNELDTIAEILQEKAAEGWELVSKTGNTWGFRRSKPRTAQFNVEVIDLENPAMELAEFVAYCEAGGWKHAFDAGDIQVFENEDLDAEPIHTDPEVKLQIVHERCKAMRIMTPIVMAVLFSLMVWKAYFPLDLYTLEDTRQLGFICLLPLFCGLLLIGVADYVVWYRKAKRAIALGDNPVYKRSAFSRGLNVVTLAVLDVCVLAPNLVDAALNDRWLEFAALAGVLLAALILYNVIVPKVSAKLNKTKSSNDMDVFAVGIVLCLVVLLLAPSWLRGTENNLELPLTLQDIGIEAVDEDPYARCEKSPLLTHYECAEFTDDYGLDYDVYITKYPKVYDVAVKDWTVPTERQYEMYEDPAEVEELFAFYEADEPGFGAEKVYYNERTKRRLHLYPDRVIRIDAPEGLTEEQMKIVAEKLTADL